MPSFKKINSEQNHKEETSQNNTAINKAGQKTIGRIKTGQNKAGRGISGKAVRKSGKAVPSSPEKKGVHGPSFFIPVLSAALAVLLFLAGSSLVLSRSRSVFEPGIQDPAGHSSTLNSSADSASPGSASPDSTSPGNTSPGSASSRRTSSDSASTESASAESSSPESLRSWLGVDTVLEILSPEPAEVPQPSESQALSSAEDSSAVPALSASPAGEAPVSSFSFVSSAVKEENTAESNSLSADPVSTADSPTMAASPESAAASTRADASAAASGTRMEMAAADQNTGKTASGKKNAAAADSTAKAASAKAAPEKAAPEKAASAKAASNKAASNKTASAKTASAKTASDKDSGNKDQNAGNKNSKNDQGDSDSEVPLTKRQKKYVQNWEELHGRDFPMETTLHDYNWDYLEYDKMWNLYYKGDKKYKIRRGIDVSEFQGEIDWDEVKKAGYDFVFVRAGHRMFESGDLLTDSRAVKNMKRAKKAGLDVGVYVFSQAVSETEAREEAQLCLDVIKKSGVEITLPVVFDPEIQTEYIARINYISGEQFTDNAVAFCKKIEKAGFTPAIYTNCSTETDILDMSRLDNAVIWYADYGIIPESPYRFTFWQYSNTGWVEGIPEGMTDLNVWFVEREEK